MSNFLLLNYEFPPLGGGAGTATQAIAKELALLGHEVRVVTTWFEGQPEKEYVDGYTVIRLKSRRKKKEGSNILEMLSYIFWAILFFSKKTHRNSSEYIISFFSIPSGIVALYLRKRFGLKYIVSLRGGDVPGFLPSSLALHHFLTNPITKLVWVNADSIVANSKGLQKLATKTAKKINKKVKYIPNGIDTVKFFPKIIKEQTNGLVVSFLFVGRLSVQKGLDNALLALAEVKEKRPKIDFKFTIVGDGPLKKTLQEQANYLGINESCQFLGWMDRERLISEYQKHDIFLFPSLDEGMPNAVLEAMASGLAIIATKIPGNDELVVNNINGELITEKNELISAIILLCDDRKLLSKYKQNSRIRAEIFQWKNVAKTYIDLSLKK
ncbi:MAG: Glycosyl transferase group 1 [Parcubacteria group bacterium GW2011_GWA2_43_11]|nr:MAG: Glycosyl transferase group 1 [Parcubacteria group bacterium GW2011_GWA2_43_11]